MGKNVPRLNLKRKSAPIRFFFFCAVANTFSSSALVLSSTLLLLLLSVPLTTCIGSFSCCSAVEVSFFFLHAFPLIVLLIYGWRVEDLGISSYGCSSSVFRIDFVAFIRIKFIRMIDTNELHPNDSYGWSTFVWIIQMNYIRMSHTDELRMYFIHMKNFILFFGKFCIIFFLKNLCICLFCIKNRYVLCLLKTYQWLHGGMK